MGFGNAPVFWGSFMDVYLAQCYRDLQEARGIQKLGRRPSIAQPGRGGAELARDQSDSDNGE
jgi:hypothetical protein